MHIWCYKNIDETTQYDYICSIKCLIMFFYFIFLFGFCYNIIKITCLQNIKYYEEVRGKEIHLFLLPNKYVIQQELYFHALL